MDIENLNGDVVELALWDEMAKSFNKDEFEAIPKPVIIAVSSCKVLEYGAKYNQKPPLEIFKTRYKDPDKEKERNRFAISTLLQQNPDSYRSARFTSDATVTGINTGRDWYYESCSKYIFKAFISDHSSTATLTFFTPNANVLTGYECSDLVKKYNIPNPCDFPTEILSLKGRRHIFQFHYNPSCETGKVDFYFDDILDRPLQLTGISMAVIQARTETFVPASNNPNINLPETTSPSQSMDKKEPEKSKATSEESTKPLKRTLFPEEPPKHKKNKTD
ncbi:nucleic acid-binding, OB-fold protein [Tanacetum coccineum]